MGAMREEKTRNRDGTFVFVRGLHYFAQVGRIQSLASRLGQAFSIAGKDDDRECPECFSGKEHEKSGRRPQPSPAFDVWRSDYMSGGAITCLA